MLFNAAHLSDDEAHQLVRDVSDCLQGMVLTSAPIGQAFREWLPSREDGELEVTDMFLLNMLALAVLTLREQQRILDVALDAAVAGAIEGDCQAEHPKRGA